MLASGSTAIALAAGAALRPRRAGCDGDGWPAPERVGKLGRRWRSDPPAARARAAVTIASEPVGHVAHRLDVGHRRDEALGHDRLRGRAGEWRLPGEHLVQDATQAVEVAPPIESRSPPACSGLMYAGVPMTTPAGVTVVAASMSATPTPKSATRRVPGLDQDVPRLHVAMHHPRGMGEGERVGHLGGSAAPPPPTAASPLQPLPQRPPSVRHGRSTGGRPAGAGVDDPQNVRMVEPGDHLDLAQKRSAPAGRPARSEQLDRDLTLVASGLARARRSPCPRARARAPCGSGRRGRSESRDWSSDIGEREDAAGGGEGLDATPSGVRGRSSAGAEFLRSPGTSIASAGINASGPVAHR